MPLSQVKTLYDNLDGNKQETKKSPKAKEHKMKENEEKKKQQQQKQQQQQQQQSEKKKQEPKEKPPKNIKDALNAVRLFPKFGIKEIYLKWKINKYILIFVYTIFY